MGATCSLGLMGLVSRQGEATDATTILFDLCAALVHVTQAARLFYEVVGDQVYKVEFRYGGPTLGTPTVEVVDDPARLAAWSRSPGGPLSWDDWDDLGQVEIHIPNHTRSVVHSGGKYELPHVGLRGVKTYQHKLRPDHGLRGRE
jgi:hypothetical protein